ncbi:hypothetical protein SAMN04488565_0936 [Leucobacter chromiiresistens]|uniref:Uncharacterized protein n=1 Tax=Leucobacter chromiiresistens TaxID=1079994 RepID=A0A1H0YJI7_9MICO|nr:hypothetical protein SAMN04488565_0936 [Leucobacter chromiiresistens]
MIPDEIPLPLAIILIPTLWAIAGYRLWILPALAKKGTHE